MRAQQAKAKQAAKLQKEVDKLTVASIDPFETLKADIAKAQLTQVRSPTGGSLPPSLGVYHTMLRVQNRPELTHPGCVLFHRLTWKHGRRCNRRRRKRASQRRSILQRLR